MSNTDLLAHFIKSEQKYKSRWNVYHTILCLGVWAVLACTLWATFNGWGSLTPL
jgi:hypothetical protein